MSKIYEFPDPQETLEDAFIEMDEIIQKFFNRARDTQTTAVKCEYCGMLYEPSKGHECKARRTGE